MRQDKRTRQANLIDRAIKERTRHTVLDNLHKPDPLGVPIQVSQAYGNVPVHNGRIRVCHNALENRHKGANPIVRHAAKAAAKRIDFVTKYIDSGLTHGQVHELFDVS